MPGASQVTYEHERDGKFAREAVEGGNNLDLFRSLTRLPLYPEKSLDSTFLGKKAPAAASVGILAVLFCRQAYPTSVALH